MRNLTAAQIGVKASLLRDRSGEKNRKLQGGKFVRSANEAVRGVWSAIHAARMDGGVGRDVWGWRTGGVLGGGVDDGVGGGAGAGGKKGAVLRGVQDGVGITGVVVARMEGGDVKG